MDMTRRSLFLSAAAATGTALALSACGPDSSDDSGSSDDSAGATTAIVTANGTEPQNKLIPTATNEVGGGRILDCLFAGLVYFDADGKTQNEMAESIDSDDSQHWTIKIKPGWTFTNGEEITAQHFVDAWNYGANTNNAQNSAYFFEPIEGYADVSAEGAAADATMSGLEATDDTTISVTLSAPQSDFTLRLGYTAFVPVPSDAYKDMDAYGEAPAGNGPYKIEDGGWDHNVAATLTVNEDYQGGRKAKNGGITFTFYQDQDTAYNDLQSGNLTVLDEIPTSAFTTFEADLEDRAVNQPAAVTQGFTIHMDNLEHFSGEEGRYRRQALSRAVDRESICKAIFNGTRTPATDYCSPVIEGTSDSLKGAEVLEYDEAAAKELWAKAEAISPYDGTFTIGYNADADHKGWVDAVCNSIANVLGIKAQGQSFPDFKSLLDKEVNRQMTGAWRSGWQADYPSLYNFLGPIFSVAAADGDGSNSEDYKNEKFDQLLKDGLAESDVDAGIAKWQEAEEMLLQDLPTIPLWFQNVTGGYSEGTEDVAFGWNSVPLYYNIVPAS